MTLFGSWRCKIGAGNLIYNLTELKCRIERTGCNQQVTIQYNDPNNKKVMHNFLSTLTEWKWIAISHYPQQIAIASPLCILYSNTL